MLQQIRCPQQSAIGRTDEDTSVYRNLVMVLSHHQLVRSVWWYLQQQSISLQ